MIPNKEIEQLGWNHAPGEYFDGRFTKDNFQLHYTPTPPYNLAIAEFKEFRKDGGKWYIRFDGSCNSLEDLQTILKLLNI